MPLSRVSKVYAVKDARVYKVTADNAGSATTYATGVDVPGIKEVTVSGSVRTAELRGDNGRLDTAATLEAVTISVAHAKVHLDVLAVLLGGAIVDTGTTPNQIVTYSQDSDDAFGYFRLRAVSAGADSVTGEVEYDFRKCILSSFPDLGLAEEDYRTVSFEAECNPTVGTPALRIFDVVMRETAVALT